MFALSILLGALLTPRNNRVVKNGKIVSKDKTRDKLYLTIFFFICFIIIGMRGYDVGADTHGYATQYFYSVKEKGIFKGDIEIIINCLAWVVLRFTDNYQWFLVLNAAIVCFLFAKFIYDNSSNLFLSVIVFVGMFFVQSMNLMREWLALALGLNAYSMFKKRKWFYAFIFWILACFTHLTALAFVFIPLFNLFKNKNKSIIVVTVFCLVLLVLKDYFLGFVVTLVPRYNDYVYHSYFVGEGGFNIKDLIFFAILAFNIFLLFFKSNFLKRINEYDLMIEFATLMIVAITFSLVGQKYEIVHRIVYYYSAFIIISLPFLLRHIRIQNIASALLVLAMFVMLYRNSLWDNNYISNYYFFWEV